MAEGPTWSDLRKVAAEIAEGLGEWGGLPLPVHGTRLILEKRHPLYKGLCGMRLEEDEPETELPIELHVCAGKTLEDWAEEVNTWYDYRRNAEITIWRHKDNKRSWTATSHGAGKRLKFWLNTFGVAASEAWTVDVELRAVEKLKELVSPHAFKCYMVGGGFLETSKKSRVTYLFRKSRPTIALHNKDGKVEVLSVLCLHPLGYYQNSWAGCMCPTDDVIAHLLMMRGDEHYFWRKANHHEMWSATAGI